MSTDPMSADPDSPDQASPATHAELGLMQGFPPAPEKRVTAENGLWVPPYNRWAYQNMRRLLPTAPIESATDVRPILRRPNAHIDQLQVPQIDGSSTGIEAFLCNSFTDSFVVIHGDTIVWERYLNGMTATAPHQMMSCTKSFVGLFALLAVDAGLVSEQDLVGDLVPELAASGFGTATVGHVLDMTNSLTFDEDYADPAADIHTYAEIIGLGPAGDATRDVDNLHDYLPTLPIENGLDHGTTFHYQTPTTDVVNWLTNRVSGVGFVEALGRLWQDLGAAGEAYMLVDPAGAPVAGGGLNATPEDLVRFASMILADGSLHERSIVPARVLDTIAAGGSTDAFLAGPDALGLMTDGNWSYRAQWWIRHTPGREAMMALGVNGQWIYCDRARQVAIVKQSSHPVALDVDSEDNTIMAIDAIVDVVADTITNNATTT